MPIHPVLAGELRQSKRLQKFFDSLPESSRHQIDREVREVKKEETRLRRAQHAAEYLMEAMEAELDPPPLMKAAFARNAQARQGWELMPQSLRRQYLPFTSSEPSWMPPNTPADSLETPRTRTWRRSTATSRSVCGQSCLLVNPFVLRFISENPCYQCHQR